MSSKNSAASETESEWDFHSAYGEESTVHTSRDLVDSGSECDLFLHPKSQHTLFEKQEGKSKLGKAVLTLETNETNFTVCCKHCPLLQVQNISNAGEFEVELPPESVLHLYFEDSDTSGHSSKVYSTKIPQSEPDGSRDEFPKIPHVLIADNSVIGENFHSVKKAGFDKLYQKQSSVDYSRSSRHNKAVQVSFPCRETEAGENFVSECFKPSSSHTNVKKTSVKKLETFHSAESQLADNHSYKTDSPQTIEQVYYPATSGELVISLTLEADYIDPNASLAGNVIASEDRVRKEESQKHDLAFKCKGGQQNQPLKKLNISIVPCAAQVDAGKQKHITPSTKQVENSDILGAETKEFVAVDAKSHEASQSLAKSSKSSCSSFHSNQGLSTHKLRGPCQFFPPTKYIHAYHSPHFCVWSFPDYKITSASEVKKKHPKASRCVKSVVFTKNKEAQKSKRFRHICKFHRSKALNFDSINKNTQKAKEVSELYYVPLTQATKCYYCPLFDETVNLNSAGRYSEKHLRVRRKPRKRTGGVKVVPRFSSHCLLVPINELERFQYISPIRRKNNLKMQNILNYWLGWTGQSPENNSRGEVCPTPNSSKSPYFSADGRTSIAPLLPNLRNISELRSPTVPLPNERSSPPCLQTERSPRALYLLPKDQRQPYATSMQTNRPTWSPGTSSSDGICNRSYFPCENTVKAQKERNKFTNTGVEKLYCGANHMSSGGSAPKKPPVCSCGAMLQCGLFPSEEISEIIKEKTRASPDIRRRTSRTELDRMRSPMGSFNTRGACCASCHHGFPPCSFYNTKGQGPSRNQIVKVASFFGNEFPPTNLKHDVRKSKAMKPDESKNVKFPVGSGFLQGCPCTTYPSSPQNDGFETLKHYHPECPYCRSAAQEHLIASEEQKRQNNCINRKSIFLVDCGQGIRSQCKCSQEIPIFRIGHIDMHNGNRVAVSTQKKPDCKVCTSSYVYYC